MEMYKAKANSPATALYVGVSASDTTIQVVDASKLPDAPNLATIGKGDSAETIRYTGKEGNHLTGVTRGFEGVAKEWSINTPVARFFTAYDHEAFKGNIETLQEDVDLLEDEVSTQGTSLSNLQDEVTSHLAKSVHHEYVYVTDFGAVGDGVADDTEAFQLAINSMKPVKIPPGTYLVTDSLEVYKNTVIVGSKSGSNYYNDALVKLNFLPTVKKDLFITNESVVEPINNAYIYGISIGGFSVTGLNGRYVFNLPKMSNLHLYDIKQFGGFDYGILIDGWIDCNVDRCSFQGTSIATIRVIVSYYLSTTVTFRKCYLSQGVKGLVVEEGAINSLRFDDCVFESLNTLADIYPENNVTFNDLYVENIPKTNNGYVFNLGIDGLKTSVKYASLIINGGYIQGLVNGTLTGFMNSDWFKTVAISNVVLEHFPTALKFTSNTESIYMSNVFTYSVTNLGDHNNDWNKLTTEGCDFKYTVRDIGHQLTYIGTHNMSPIKLSEGNPNGTIIPKQIGDEVLDYVNSIWYKSTGLTVNDWKSLN